VGNGPSAVKVFTGGFDKTVALWDIERERDSVFNTKVTALPVRHKSYISAVASRGQTLLSASGKNLLQSDIQSEAKDTSSRFGAKVQQIHLHPTDHDVVILEIADLDDQMRVYDLRIGLRGRPQMQFGRRD